MVDLWGRLLASKPRRTDAFEVFAAAMSGMWGLVLGAPGDTFLTSTAYRYMSAVAIEEVWTILGLVACVFQTAGLMSSWLLGGRELRILGACCSSLFLGTLGVCIFMANSGVPGGYAYSLMGLGLALTAMALHTDKAERVIPDAP